MIPFPVILCPKSTAFQNPLSLRLLQKQGRASVRCCRPRACTEEENIQSTKKAQNSVRTVSANSTVASSRCREKDGFVYRPEAVLTLLALGFLSSMAYIANTGRRLATDISARSMRIRQKNSIARRYKARLREKLFLESAIEATATTLNNTEDFLAKQIKRAEQAEERLRQLEVSSADIDAAARRNSELKIQLKEKEAKLENERLSTEENAVLLSTIKADVDKRRETLAIFEEEVLQSQRELSTAQQKASESLKAASAEKEHLEAILERKRAQLGEETTVRDRFMQSLSEEEGNLQKTETLVDRTLNDIEARRRKIDTVAKEAERIGKVASEEKLALETAIVREIRAEDVEDSLRDISEKQKVLRSQIQTSMRSHAQHATLCSDLRKEIEEKDKVLQERRAKLNALNREKRSSRVSGSRGSERSAERGKASSETRGLAADGTISHVFESAVIQDNIHSTPLTDSVASAKTKAPTAPHTAVADGDLQVPAKRRRGRPRKTDGESSGEPQRTKPKRGRGRPSTRLSEDSAKELVPKKKRGRPRKISAAKTQGNNAPGSSSIAQHQDSNH